MVLVGFISGAVVFATGVLFGVAIKQSNMNAIKSREVDI